MRKKIILAAMLAAGAVLGVMSAPNASAQTTYPDVSKVKPFSPGANYMSLPGYLRMRVYQQSGQWISHDAALQAVTDQGGFTGNGTGQPTQ